MRRGHFSRESYENCNAHCSSSEVDAGENGWKGKRAKADVMWLAQPAAMK